MAPQEQTIVENNITWQQALRNCITSPAELANILKLPQLITNNPHKTAQNKHFSLRVPREFVARMKVGVEKDPLLLQVLPQKQTKTLPQFSLDPLQEKKSAAAPGLLHKFKDRVLLITSGACAINCRYCFRQHFPYAEHTLSSQRIQPALEYILQHQEIKEVILSGGDPLCVKNESLAELLLKLSNIPHLKRLRIHTRLPIVIPQRIDNHLLQILKGIKLPVTIVVHCNHPQEINLAVKKHIYKLKEIPTLSILNQTVLLKGINDSSQTLMELSESLYGAGIMPYYLHILDNVHGAENFSLPMEKTKKIMWELLENLPGFLTPKLVVEKPGLPSKLPINLGPCPWL